MILWDVHCNDFLWGEVLLCPCAFCRDLHNRSQSKNCSCNQKSKHNLINHYVSCETRKAGFAFCQQQSIYSFILFAERNMLKCQNNVFILFYTKISAKTIFVCINQYFRRGLLTENNISLIRVLLALPIFNKNQYFPVSKQM